MQTYAQQDNKKKTLSNCAHYLVLSYFHNFLLAYFCFLLLITVLAYCYKAGFCQHKAVSYWIDRIGKDDYYFYNIEQYSSSKASRLFVPKKDRLFINTLLKSQVFFFCCSTAQLRIVLITSYYVPLDARLDCGTVLHWSWLGPSRPVASCCCLCPSEEPLPVHTNITNSCSDLNQGSNKGDLWNKVTDSALFNPGMIVLYC